jgi:hypothetical protein
MVRAQSLAVKQKDVLPVMAMAKSAYNKASSPCSRLVLSDAAQANTFRSLAKLAMVAVNIKNKKLWKLKFQQALMMGCEFAQ